MKALRYLFIFLFIGLLYFPLLNKRVHFIKKPPEGIYPHLPRPYLKHLDVFPKQYEEYFDKTFEMKPWMVAENAKFKMNTFNLSPNPDRVIVGKNHWLFIAGAKMDAYRGVKPFTPEELEALKTRMHARALHAKEKFGTKMYFVMIPLKQSIYPEYLPFTIKKIHPQTRYDQVHQLFENDSLITLIDIKKELLEAKSAHLLYYVTDNHWNDIAGYVAYKKIASVLHQDYPAVVPMGLDHFVMDSSQEAVGGEARMLNAGEWLKEKRFDYSANPESKVHEGKKRGYKSPDGFEYPWDYEIVRETNDTTLPDALIIRDSFCDAMHQFLSENFNRTVYIFDAWQYKANYDIVDTEKPDVIIYMSVESELHNYLKFE